MHGHFAEVPPPVPALCRELGISSATFYTRRTKSGGMDVSLISRMKDLEAEMLPEALAKKR